MTKIGILATGDEVIEGEILNSNTQIIAQKLTNAGFYIGLHLACRDDLEIINNSLSFILSAHDVIIIIGGLGPTVDDITRYAVSAYTNRSLEFYPSTWQWLEKRYKKLNQIIPETNRQQAMFPKGSKVLMNAHGSADGCLIHFNKKIIIMLPGPPLECLAILDKDILPFLKKNFIPHFPPLFKWRVFGISESKLADIIKNQFSEFKDEIAYRWHYPYIDVKYRNADIAKANRVKNQLGKFLSEYIICSSESSASSELKRKINTMEEHILIDDNVTGGVLQKALLSPKVFQKLSFEKANKAFKGIQIIIKGIEPYWCQKDNNLPLFVDLEIIKFNQSWNTRLELPYQPLQIIPYVTELISSKINKQLG